MARTRAVVLGRTGAVELVDAVPYDLRHTFVSLLVHEGRSVPYVAAMAGHSPRVCLERYAHAFAEAQLGAGVPMAEAITAARAEVGVYPGCTVAVLRASRWNRLPWRMEDTGLEPVTSTLPA